MKIYAKESGENLLDLLLKERCFVDNPCNGKGICGKCKVRIVAGTLSDMTEAEEAFLKPEEIACGVRLACLTEGYGELEVVLLQKERKAEVLTKGYVPQFEKEYHDSGLGIAIDIGTTTVVTSLIDLTNGQELASASRMNAQKQFGLDVLTRITYEYEHPETGIKELQQAIVDSINDMIAEVCVEAQKAKEDIREIHVAANCTMTHMLLGVDARSIGVSPYKPVFLGTKELLAKEIGIDCSDTTLLYCLPHVSAYIGGDIVAGAYVCELHKEKGNVLFIDIGTNGEIVLANNGKLLTCSCAAGPALEGMNISSGMRASAGAIEDVLIADDGVHLKTIKDLPVEGLCGSGILAAVKELLRNGFVKKSGVFIKPEGLADDDWRADMLKIVGKNRAFILQKNPELLVTQQDVRQVQLAKGAILSGIRALMNCADIQMEELDKVMIAGQFGAHLPADSLIGIGLLPNTARDKLIYVGNSSKTGAYMTLMSRQVRKEMEELSKRMSYIELAETKDYERVFAECMTFAEF